MVFGLGKKKKKVSYNIRLTPEVWQHLPQLTKKQIAELLARLKKSEERAEKLEKKIKELEGKIEPKEVKVLKEALKQKKKIEKEKEERSIVLVPYAIISTDKGLQLKEMDIRPLPYGGGKIKGKKGVYKYFVGWEVCESENGLGRSVNFIFKTDKKSKSVGRIRPNPSADISILDEPYIVQKLKSGIYDMPIKADGTLMRETSIENLQNEYNTQIELLKQKLAELKKRIEDLEAENYEMSKKYETLLEENKRLGQQLALANYRADVAEAKSLEQTRKVMDVMREHSAMLSAAMEAQLNEMLERRMNWLLADKNRELRKMLEEAFGKPIDDATWQKIQNRFYTMVEKAKEMIPKREVIKPSPTIKEKGEKK